MQIEIDISAVSLGVAFFCGAIQDRQRDLDKTLKFQACLGQRESEKLPTRPPKDTKNSNLES